MPEGVYSSRLGDPEIVIFSYGVPRDQPAEMCYFAFIREADDWKQFPTVLSYPAHGSMPSRVVGVTPSPPCLELLGLIGEGRARDWAEGYEDWVANGRPES